jgi:hypothetical protein
LGAGRVRIQAGALDRALGDEVKFCRFHFLYRRRLVEAMERVGVEQPETAASAHSTIVKMPSVLCGMDHGGRRGHIGRHKQLAV